MIGSRIPIGLGTDLTPVARIAHLRAEHGDRFLGRVFTASERDYALAHSRRVDEHLAVRFAAKEAALKALGTGWSHGIAWTDIEVVRSPTGEPSLGVTGRAGDIADRKGVTGWLVSLSHAGDLALATVVALAGGTSDGV